DLSCSICLELFSDPVLLWCGHSFCRKCILRCWGSRAAPRCCPQCKRTFPRPDFKINRHLASIVENFKEVKLGAGVEPKCKIHPAEELRVFCHSDHQILCCNCAFSQEHRGHDLTSVQDAISIFKEKLGSSLKVLEDESVYLEKQCVSNSQEIDEILRLSKELDWRIGADFAELHRFLEREEQTLRARLKEREKSLIRRLEDDINQMWKEYDQIKETINGIQSFLAAQDQTAALHFRGSRTFCGKGKYSCKNTISPENSLSLKIAAFPELWGPLQYITWRKMLQVITPVPSPLKLDPDTASSALVLTKSRTRMKMRASTKDLPEAPQRFLNYMAALGTERISTGRHYWEVAVGENPAWLVGAAWPDVNRMDCVKPAPENGFWTLRLRGGSQYWASDQPLSLVARPQRVGVHLDMDLGFLSFYDARDMSHIYTYNNVRTQDQHACLCPFFCLDLSEEGINKEPLSIFHLN
uniref:Tripartite motif containing 69 n=1 Tax=Latimeria chalumnae TaxID=7897 RepID=H3A0N4_LATCH